MQYAESLGYRVPQDLKIIGYDGTSLIRSIYPKLTTIIQPTYQIAENAVETLIQEIDGKTHDTKEKKHSRFPFGKEKQQGDKSERIFLNLLLEKIKKQRSKKNLL